MKKSIMTLLFVVGMIANSFGQDLVFNEWFTKEVTDEFGDVVQGNTVEMLLLNGTFSNSATLGSELIMKVTDYGDHAEIWVYEYNSSPTQIADNLFCSISIKLPNGEIVKLDGSGYKDGAVGFSGESYDAFMQNLVPGCKIRIDESDCKSYGSSKWLATWEE